MRQLLSKAWQTEPRKFVSILALVAMIGGAIVTGKQIWPYMPAVQFQVGQVEAKIVRIEEDVDELKIDIASVQPKLSELAIGQLNTQRLLIEQTLDTLPPGDTPRRRELKRELREIGVQDQSEKCTLADLNSEFRVDCRDY